MATYKQAHARAVHRIGLDGARSQGATPHAHRHAYGRRLMRAGLDPVIRRKALHHKSLASQAVYTTPNATDVTRVLNDAQMALDMHANGVDDRTSASDCQAFLSSGFEDIDPDGLLSGRYPKLLGHA